MSTENTTITIEKLDGQALVEAAQKELTFAKGFVIDSPEMYDEAAGFLAEVKGKLNALEAKRQLVSVPLNDALKAHNAMFKAPRESLEDAEKVTKKAMLDWSDKVERQRQEDERLAKQQADEERRKQEAQAAELRAQSEQALQGVSSAANDEEAEAALATAENLAKAAEVVQETAQLVVVRPTFVAPARAAGTSIRKTWKARVDDKLALIKHIAANAEKNPELLALLDVSDQKLNARAKAMEQHLNLPGVTAFQDRVLGSRAA